MAIVQNGFPARPLNSRQLDTLFLVCKGLRNAEIATQLQVSKRTVKGYVAQLLLIFDVTNRTELVGRTFEMNVLRDRGARFCAALQYHRSVPMACPLVPLLTTRFA